MAWALDLDGVVWLSEVEIPGAAEAIDRLRRAGEHVVFVTNNSSVHRDDVVASLARLGIEAQGAVVTSAMAAARLIPVGSTALLCAGPGVERELLERGVRVVHDGDADVVVVGFHREFNFDRMAVAARAVHRGARLVATNDDSTYPTPEGLLPGGGAILAGIERAAGVSAVVAGKPYAPMAEVVRAMVGPNGVMVGDRSDTDGRFARVLGYEFALVLSGVTTRTDLPIEPPPDRVGADLAEVVDVALNGHQVAG